MRLAAADGAGGAVDVCGAAARAGGVLCDTNNTPNETTTAQRRPIRLPGEPSGQRNHGWDITPLV